MGSMLTRLDGAGVHDRLRTALGDEGTIRLQRLLARPCRRSLTALAFVYWTGDKAKNHYGAPAYTEHYSRHLRHLRREPIRLLEIGIGGFDSSTRGYGSATWGGASLRMWRDYFRRGEVHGLDIHEKRISEPRIHVHRGDQSDATFMRDFGRRYGPFDVIIDDGSHVSSHIRASFEALFEDSLKVGGYYVIEDLWFAYQDAKADEGSTSVDLVKSLVDAVNLVPSRVGAMHLYRHIAFIQKGGGGRPTRLRGGLFVPGLRARRLARSCSKRVKVARVCG